MGITETIEKNLASATLTKKWLAKQLKITQPNLTYRLKTHFRGLEIEKLEELGMLKDLSQIEIEKLQSLGLLKHIKAL